MQSLKYHDPVSEELYQGRSFMKKAYQDLMTFYIENKGVQEENLFKASMEKLDQKYSDNLHLYFKNLFQVFGWVYDHRRLMTKSQVALYINLVRSQLSLNEMMLLYMNTSYLKRNFFFKILLDFDFFESYNTDGFGKGTEGVENKFIYDAETYTSLKVKQVSTQLPSSSSSFSKETLHKAIENSEISIHYQPIVSVTSGQITSAEGLMRWKETNPSILMNQFENNGLTFDIFMYTLHRICRDIKRSKFPNTYSMNLSLNQLLLSDFLVKVEEAFKVYQIPHNRLLFEITEDRALFDRPEIKKTIDELRKKGHLVGIDDFGNGYFSFHDLVDLPIDFVKLDKQLVHKLERGKQKKMIHHIVEMTKLNNLHVTIEGIETTEQCNNWKDKDIDAMQGFLFSYPINHKKLRRLKKVKMM